MKNKIHGFTFIELLTAITIMTLIVMTVGVPYMFYQNKAKVRVTKKELTQMLYEGRNMATNGFSSGTVNQSVGILFDLENEKNVVTYIGLPFSASGSDIRLDNPALQVIKKRTLEPGMQIDSVGGKRKVLFFYDAVYGDGKYYSWTTSNIREDMNADEIPIVFSYKGAGTGSLQSSITYYTKTNIVDY